MKLHIYSTLLGSAALLALAGCNDFLDKAPDSRTVIVNPEQCRQLLVSAYSEGNYGTMAELSSDNIIDNLSPDPDNNNIRYNLSYRNYASVEAFSWEDIKSDNDIDSPSNIWENCYHAIAVCNQALQSIAKLEAQGRASEVSAMKGEALICRAYHHWILAINFCMPYRGPELSKSIPGIPYMEDIEDKVSVHYDRGNLADVYDKIEADLLAALPLINDGIYEIPKYHFNRRAANAFAARYYLFRRDYPKVEQYANAALGGPDDEARQLSRTFWSMDFPGGTSESQVMGYANASEPCNFLILTTSSAFMRTIGGRFAHNRDAMKATIKSAGPTWDGWTFHPCWDGKMWLRGSQDYGALIMKAGVLFEYIDKIAGIGYVHTMRCEFTSEETLLARAEARFFMKNLPGAVNDLKIWDEARWQNLPSGLKQSKFLDEALIRSWYTTKKNIGYGIVNDLNIDEVCPCEYTLDPADKPILDCILHFRRIETVDDGLRWFDLNRYGIEIDHHIGLARVEHLSIHDPRRAMQIPADVISAGFEPNRKPSTSVPELGGALSQGPAATLR